MNKIFSLFFCFILLLGCSKTDPPDLSKKNESVEQESGSILARRPNVLVIVVDDVGFNDLGFFGSEIRTPNIDALAQAGVVLTGFHASPNCSPTRAMLLSGTDAHIAGLGSMHEEAAPNQQGKQGYEGYLNFQVAAISELFQDAGYQTYMTGKWHLGLTEDTSPAARGFDKSFTLLQGGAGAFSNMLQIAGPNKALYREDYAMLDSLPDDFYSTAFYTDRLIEYIDSGMGNDKPFFAYLAYTSPHWPLQAPQESITKYNGVYDEGYEVLLQKRLQNLKERGLIDPDVKPFPRIKGEKAWNELTSEEKKYQSKLMQIYAAMIDDVDIYIGKLLDHLKSIGEYENTIIFFMSDNGPEAHDFNFSFVEAAEFSVTAAITVMKTSGIVIPMSGMAQTGDSPVTHHYVCSRVIPLRVEYEYLRFFIFQNLSTPK